MFKELYDSLPPYGQLILTLGVAVVGIFAAWKGWVDSRNKKTDGVAHSAAEIPMWIMVGPAHDALQAIHDMAEESRSANERLEKSNTILTDVAKILTDIDRGQAYHLRLLETVLRNQELHYPERAIPMPTGRRREPT